MVNRIMKMKLISTAVAALLTIPALACWYKRVNYIDYIYGINDIKDVTQYEIVKPSESTTTF